MIDAKNAVYFKKINKYDYSLIRPAFFEMMGTIGSLKIAANDTVLIKPNFLTHAKPEQAVVTHPLIVKAAVEYVLEMGGRPRISDSPASGSVKKIMKAGGFDEALKGLDVEIAEFEDYVKVDVGEPFGEIEIARDAMETDHIINLPKFKTHVMMLMTLGVKNLFGCIVGLKKPAWHLKTGVDGDYFARLLVKIYAAVNPTVTIIEGILGMEGQGPGKSGVPRQIGVLIGSQNSVCADIGACRMVRMRPESLFTTKAAIEMGLALSEIDVRGEFFEIDGYKMPIRWSPSGGPAFIQRFTRRHLTQRPVVDPEACKLCGDCWTYCPAKAIEKKDDSLVFDYDKCIRCYCCIEVCHHAALKGVEPVFGKLINRLTKPKHA